MKSDVLVVVVAYNNVELTKRCVAALQTQTQETRFIVWDNASTDGTGEWLENQDDVEYHLSDENLYWTPAINAAVEKCYAGERYIGWLNNDAAPARTCMARLTQSIEARPEIGLCAPVTAAIGGPQDVVSNPDVHRVLNRGGNVESEIAAFPSRRVTFVLGACSMTTAAVWEQVGPLDPDMVLGADDHDYSIRVKEHGYEVHVIQSALCDHVGHASAKSGQEGQAAWNDLGGKCWDVFNKKWAGFYATEEEAIKAHWGGEFHPEFIHGTGWANEQRATLGLPPLP